MTQEVAKPRIEYRSYTLKLKFSERSDVGSQWACFIRDSHGYMGWATYRGSEEEAIGYGKKWIDSLIEA